METMVIAILILLVLLYIILIFWKNYRSKKQYLQMQSNVEVNKKVLFSNGLIGRIKSIDKKSVVIKCGETSLTADRASIQAILNDD